MNRFAVTAALLTTFCFTSIAFGASITLKLDAGPASPISAKPFQGGNGRLDPNGGEAAITLSTKLTGPPAPESASVSVEYCRNGTFVPGLVLPGSSEGSDAAECDGVIGAPADGAYYTLDDAEAEHKFTASLPAGAYQVLAKAGRVYSTTGSNGGIEFHQEPQVTGVAEFRVVDECLWKVVEATDIAGARPGDPVPCSGQISFKNEQASIKLRSGRDGSVLLITAQSMFMIQPLIEKRKMGMSLIGQKVGHLEYAPGREMRKVPAAIVTDTVSLALDKGPSKIIIDEDGRTGQTTVHMVRGSAALNSGASLRPPKHATAYNLCVWRARQVVPLGSGKSILVGKNKKIPGALALARKACKSKR